MTMRNNWRDGVTKLDQMGFKHLPFSALFVYKKVANSYRDIPEMSEITKATVPGERPY